MDNQVRGQPGQKFHKTLSQPMAGCSGAHLSLPATRGITKRRMVVQASTGIKGDSISKLKQKGLGV
jgi:hypothetical protein